jgi:hypothetical protein
MGRRVAVLLGVGADASALAAKQAKSTSPMQRSGGSGMAPNLIE